MVYVSPQRKKDKDKHLPKQFHQTNRKDIWGESCVINVEWHEQAPKKVRANKPQNYNHCKRKQNKYVD